MRIPRTYWLGLPFAMSMALFACIKPPSGPIPENIENAMFKSFNKDLIGYVLAPNYRELSASAYRLKQRVNDLCGGKINELDATRSAWKETMLTWQRINWFTLGPVVTNDIYAEFEGNSEDDVKSQNGLRNIGRLLFSDNVHTDIQSTCAVIQQSINQLTHSVDFITTEYKDNRDTFVATYIEGTYPFKNEKQVTEKTIQTWLAHINHIVERKITSALDIEASDEIDLIDSHLTTQSIQANVAALRIAYIGGGKKGLDDILQENNFVDLSYEISRGLAFAEQTAASLPPSFEQAVKTEYGRRTLKNLAIDLEKLHTLIEKDLSQALNLHFGSTDKQIK